MPVKYDNLYIQATVYLGKDIVTTTANGQQANWITNEVGADEILQIEENAQIEVNREGIQVKRPSHSSQRSGQAQAHYIFPSNEMNTWLENFYELAW